MVAVIFPGKPDRYFQLQCQVFEKVKLLLAAYPFSKNNSMIDLDKSAVNLVGLIDKHG